MNVSRVRPSRIALLISFAVVMSLALPLERLLVAAPVGSSHTFSETGHTVRGLFWTYWQQQGGLGQFGYPLSEERAEVSDLDDETYTVQYFERAVFEWHPENSPPYDVLLSQLGTVRYRALYGVAGAPGQQANSVNPRYFPETGHTLGGLFRTYWDSHGGLAQQGYPLSDEFPEVSALDSQPYTVQYFERAVFEYHPQNPPPYQVLLSQLGTFQYRCKYQDGPCPHAAPPPSPSPAPTGGPAACVGLPANQDLTVTPACGVAGFSFSLVGRGFQPGEAVGRYYTSPRGEVVPGRAQSTADGTGQVSGVRFDSTPQTLPGVWAATFEGVHSHHKAIGYFQIQPYGLPPGADCTGLPSGQGLTVTPPCGLRGTGFSIQATGFAPGELVSRYYTGPDGEVIAGSTPAPADSSGVVSGYLFRTTPTTSPGLWAATYEGQQTHYKAIGYFKVLP